MFDEILCLLKTYQTVFTGILGFTGVIITMLANAKMQRNQQERNNRHRANSIRVALKSELNSNKLIYEMRIEQIGGTREDQSILVPSRIQDNVYRELLKDIGLLSEGEVEKILDAYGLVSELPYKMKIISNSKSSEGEPIQLDGKRLSIVKGMHEVVVPKIVEAIGEINKHLKNA
jgi:hypothetical protein